MTIPSIVLEKAAEIAASLTTVGFARFEIGGRDVEVSAPTLNVIFDSETAAEKALNLGITVAYAALASDTLELR